MSKKKALLAALRQAILREARELQQLRASGKRTGK